MSSSTFELICQRLKPHLMPSKNAIRKTIPVRKQVAIALYKLASCAEYWVVANQFDTHKSVVHKCLYNVCKAIYVEFKDEYLAFLNEAEAQEIGHGFEGICGIPNVPHSNSSSDMWIQRFY
ncbi:hypothetical protein C0J52_25386 [Blattella germanica]|nr:hypothetical protein C0J52_25386 [Blattella germanica]